MQIAVNRISNFSNCLFVITMFTNKTERGEVHLEELSVTVHEKQNQGFTLGSSQFVILDNCSLKSAADQGLIISLKGNITEYQWLLEYNI